MNLRLIVAAALPLTREPSPACAGSARAEPRERVIPVDLELYDGAFAPTCDCHVARVGPVFGAAVYPLASRHVALGLRGEYATIPLTGGGFAPTYELGASLQVFPIGRVAVAPYLAVAAGLDIVTSAPSSRMCAPAAGPFAEGGVGAQIELRRPLRLFIDAGFTAPFGAYDCSDLGSDGPSAVFDPPNLLRATLRVGFVFGTSAARFGR